MHSIKKTGYFFPRKHGFKIDIYALAEEICQRITTRVTRSDASVWCNTPWPQVQVAFSISP